MDIHELADTLVDYCSEGKFEEAQRALYSDSATSDEPSNSPGFKSVTGLQAIIDKGAQFRAMIEEVHSIEVSDPVIAGDYFSIALLIDVTLKGMGRVNMDEVAVYRVKDGKVVSEQFFYSPQ